LPDGLVSIPDAHIVFRVAFVGLATTHSQELGDEEERESQDAQKKCIEILEGRLGARGRNRSAQHSNI
jgi:hypothetical protein